MQARPSYGPMMQLLNKRTGFWLSDKFRQFDFGIRRPRPGAALVSFAHQTVIAGMTDAVIVLDAEDRVVELNPAARLILNQTNARVLGKSIEELFQCANLSKDMSTSRGANVEVVTCNGNDRQTFQQWIHLLTNGSGHQSGRLMILRDISERKMLAAQIEEQNRELKELASRDELTGILSKRLFIELGHREFIRSRHFGHPLSAIGFDIDHLRRVNDVHGQEASHQVLRAVAAVVQNNIHDTDLFARSGAEEFVLLLPETNLSSACQVAERIRKAVGEHGFPINQETARLTISLGVAELTDETRQLADLLTAADNAMEKAKQAGRNRIFFADHSLARHFYFDFLPA